VFLFPFEDVHTRNHESFPINFRSFPVSIDDTSHLAATMDSRTLYYPCCQDVLSMNSVLDPVSTVNAFVTVFLCKLWEWGGGGRAY